MIGCKGDTLSIDQTFKGSIILCQLKPVDDDFFGECRIFYGPIKEDSNESKNVKKHESNT